MLRYYRLVKFQVHLLLHFVNDMLDYRLFKKGKFECNKINFDPETTIRHTLEIFEEQARQQQVYLDFDIKESLSPPVAFGQRSERSIQGLFSSLSFGEEQKTEPVVLPRLVGDSIRLQQVLINLIKNAMKFTSERGFIHLSVAFERAEKMLIVHLLDSGKGINREDLGKLFRRYGKLIQEDSSVNREGSGLGLAICQAIVAKNDGIIEV